jgi:peptidoglycan/xylan/chitin deacetylase (PgdA/CDA1 family)
MSSRSRSAGTVLACLLLSATLSGGQTGSPIPERRIAITIDDLPTVSVTGSQIDEAERTTRELVAALKRHEVPAIGFVNEQKLQPDGRVDRRRVALLQQWIDAGLELGNHTFSHQDLHTVSLEAFQRDVVAGEGVSRELLRKAGKELRYFRHPFLHTGLSGETRRKFESFLKERRYVVAPVTVDNYDYQFAAAYDRAVASDDGDVRQKVVRSYLEYMEAVVAYYEQQSAAIIEREIAQTLLLHANALNAATIDRLAVMLKRRGYRFVSLGDALKDPAYQSADAYYGPAGITWLHRWALTKGKKGTFFAGEPAVPEWIELAAR